MIVGYLTVVFGDHIPAKSVRYLVDEIAGEIIDRHSVDAVKCDVGELDGAAEIEFYREAHEA